MLSRIYEGQLTHHRSDPAHTFDYKYWMVFLNLDEIDELCALSPFISKERFNVLSFYREDYLPSPVDLKAAVGRQVEDVSGQPFNGEVFLLTSIRHFGYAMNPLSLFFCTEGGDITHIVAEVHNTPWDERHVYVLSADGSGELKVNKNFHVSPFMPMDTEYQWKVSPPGETLAVSIDVTKDNETLFTAALALESRPWSRASLHRLMFIYGVQSLNTIRRIYLQALRLWFKKAPFYPHPNRDVQGDIT